MADKRISDLTSMTTGDIANGLLPIVDVDEGNVLIKTKNITPQVIHNALNMVNNQISFLIDADGTYHAENDIGYNATISITRASQGNYQITSDVAFTSKDSIKVEQILANDTNVYFISKQLASSTQINITVYDFLNGGNPDLNLRIKIERVQ